MCDKKPYCGTRIDPCIIDQIAWINLNSDYETILSCCGHNKYKSSIIIININGSVFEWFSGIELSKYYKNGHIRHKYYKKDDQGYYYIPEVIEFYNSLKKKENKN